MKLFYERIFSTNLSRKLEKHEQEDTFIKRKMRYDK